MKYFLHDSNSFNDEKITELFCEFGYEGLGLFYTILEKFAAQEKPIKTSVLKSQLKVGKKLERCWNFMESIGIIHSNNGESFNKQLLKFSEKYQIKKQENAERVKQWRENQLLKENVTLSEHVRNTPKVNIIKDNKSKVKESKDETVFECEIFPSFLDFWNLYDKKIDPKSCEKIWAKIPQVEREKIMIQIPLYKHSQPDKKYRKNPSTYLNNKSWNDEIINNNSQNGQSATKNLSQSAIAKGVADIIAQTNPDGTYR